MGKEHTSTQGLGSGPPALQWASLLPPQAVLVAGWWTVPPGLARLEHVAALLHVGKGRPDAFGGKVGREPAQPAPGCLPVTPSPALAIMPPR